jgi:hypothetical protein
MNLHEFCAEFEAAVRKAGPDWPEPGRGLIGRLAGESGWFGEVLERIILDPKYQADQRESIWPNEITIYRCPEFTLLAYLWQPRQADLIHDHGSWGVIGVMAGPILERKYDRLDDGSREGYAEVNERTSHVLGKGQGTSVLPLDKGIHRMENIGTGVGITLNAYGKSVRKGYIQFFDPESRSCWKAYAPSRLKQILAVHALRDLLGPSSADVLRKGLGPASPAVRKEIESILNSKK